MILIVDLNEYKIFYETNTLSSNSFKKSKKLNEFLY